MTRQLEQKAEERETRRRNDLVRCLDFGLVGALGNQGWTVRGFAIKYGSVECILSIRVERDGKWFISFVSADSVADCFLRADRLAAGNLLRWKPDKYQKKQT